MATVAIPANTTALLLDIEGTTTPITFVKVSFYFCDDHIARGALLTHSGGPVVSIVSHVFAECHHACTLLLNDVKLLLVLSLIIILYV
jgi:methionine salvage enolase-phosphatase E1